MDLKKFIFMADTRKPGGLPAVSLFSGAGISDIGYELAGFSFVVQCEIDPDRVCLGTSNFRQSNWICGDVRKVKDDVVQSYRNRVLSGLPPALLTLTPPCQGMSSSNPGRGKITNPHESDERNLLLLESLSVIKELKPRIVVAENVAPLLNRIVQWNERQKSVVSIFVEEMQEYQTFIGVIEMADYGVPQLRKRAIIVSIRKEEEITSHLFGRNLLPWPRPTHSEKLLNGKLPWITISQWLESMHYPTLDARSCPESKLQPLHFVPHYPEGDSRYELVAAIPPNSGKNAYNNDKCLSCNMTNVPLGLAYCPICGALLKTRPVVQDGNGGWRLIKGFASSYRRATPDRPAPTITTNTSHLGSDNKIHPFENRVLSTLECADLQTIPRFFDWSWAFQTKHKYVVRNVIGEALPSYYSFIHGKLIKELLAGKLPESKLSRIGIDNQNRRVLTA